MIQIGLIISEIWPVNVKSRGPVYSSRRVYSAKYGIAGYILTIETTFIVLRPEDMADNEVRPNQTLNVNLIKSSSFFHLSQW